MDISESQQIGNRVERARKALGMTNYQLAGATGMSESWIRGVQKGRIPLTKQGPISKLVNVLKVDTDWLLCQPYCPTEPAHDAGHNAVPALRKALQRSSLILSGHPGIYPQAPLVPLADLRDEVDRTTRRRQDANLPAVMWQLPQITEALNTGLLETSGGASDDVYALMVEAGHLARMVLNQLGFHDLAWVAVDNAANAAARLGDPLLKACSAWDRCGSLLHSGDLGETIAVAEAAMRDLEERMGNPSPQELSLWGALQLRCAVASSRRDDSATAQEWLRAAEETANRLGYDRNDYNTVFGPQNVLIHAAEVAVEQDAPNVCLQKHAALDMSKVASKERRTRHGIDVARAYGQLGRDEVAVHTLRHAAELAPHYVRNHPLARALVQELLQRGHESAMAAGLGILEREMGLT